jgi:8-hydroxy-5-deazaflavin:NADPH oxidoreductase
MARKDTMRIGIIGAGMIGSTVAKLWVDAGHEVRLASRHPDELEPLVEKLGQRASAGTPTEAARFGEVVMLTVPLKAVQELARDLAPLLAGKVVLDTGNAYAQRDGDVARQATSHPEGSAGWAAARFPRARWVKAFNTVYYKVLEKEAHRAGDRVGIPLAGDDRGALDVAAQLVRDAGFDPVIVGPLARGREFEPGTRPYNTGMGGQELRRLFSTAEAAARPSPEART